MPNFRDYGRTVDRQLLDKVASLQRKYGLSWASEAGLRRMVWEDGGHMPGLDTVRRALDRLERWGIVEQYWLAPGGVLPDGRSPCTHGTRLVWIPRCRTARQARAVAARRTAIHGRFDRRRAITLAEARARIASADPPRETTAQEFDAARRRAQEMARGARHLWDDPHPSRPKPPNDA